MGQEERQSHRFPCRGCGEDICIALEVDYEKIAHRVVFEDNAEAIDEVAGAAIVNLDANFLISEDDQGKDLVFSRLKQMHDIVKSWDSKFVDSLPTIPSGATNRRPFRRPDYAAEWRDLKRAWSLGSGPISGIPKTRLA